MAVGPWANIVLEPEICSLFLEWHEEVQDVSPKFQDRV